MSASRAPGGICAGQAKWRFRIETTCVRFLPMKYGPRIPVLTILLVFGTTTAVYSAQTAFPAKPLDRAQVLVWMDFGDESGRVMQLIGRVGIDFQPTPEYLQLLKDSGGSAALIDSVTHAKMTPAAAGMGDDAFGHLSGCMLLAHKKQFVQAQKECAAATSEEASVSYFALGNVLIKAGNAA